MPLGEESRLNPEFFAEHLVDALTNTVDSDGVGARPVLAIEGTLDVGAVREHPSCAPLVLHAATELQWSVPPSPSHAPCITEAPRIGGAPPTLHAPVESQ